MYYYFICIIFIYFSLTFTDCENDAEILVNGNVDFPTNFIFGAATSAYQIEGAFNQDGKGASIWDILTHKHPELITDKSNGDIGPDSYNRFHQDLDAIKELGLNFYRFSISWARLLPNADSSIINKAAIKYYNMIINELLKYEVQPMVTMYHYDLPQELQKIGGLTNPLFIEYFENYANILFQYFGDRVKLWITFNEPFDYCVEGYGTANIAPLINSSGIGEYLCIDHTIKAHALAFQLYKRKYFVKFGGKIGITLSSRFFYSKAKDENLINRAMQFTLGWIAHPLYSAFGGYPDLMVEQIKRNSLNENRTWSRLPEMNEYWKNITHKAADFLGINYYTSRYVELSKKNYGQKPSWKSDSRIKVSIDNSWKRGKSSWLYKVPQGLGDLLRWIKNEYNNIEVYITENGWSDEGQLEDDDRIEYIKDHLVELAQAIKDNCKVSGYAVWSVIDNFEWMKGYTERFGLYFVNFTSVNKERIRKKSAIFYKNLIESRKL